MSATPAMTMTTAAESPGPVRWRGSMVFAVVACGWIMLRVPFGWQQTMADLAHRARAFLLAKAPSSQRVEAMIGLRPDDEALLRDYFRGDGRIVTYYPVDRLPPELRDEATRRIEIPMQGLRNLLYPHPRDCAYARNGAELQAALSGRLEGRLVVVDLAQDDTALPVAGEFDLLRERWFDSVRVRYWSLRKVGR